MTSHLPPSLESVQAKVRKMGDPADAEFLSRFFKTGPGEYGEGDRFLGVRVPALRRLAKEYKDLPFLEGARLLKSEYHEERLLALLIFMAQFKKGDEATRTKIYFHYMRSIRSINNWDLVDVSAEHIPGAYLADKDRSPLYEFARSRNLWKRRIAILSTFHYLRRRDFQDTLAIAALLLDDPHDLIHKAVGWLLREVGKRDFELELSFLASRHHRMPRTMLRYAIEKFPETLRQDILTGRWQGEV